jgi:malate permease and related proteins
MLLLSIFANDLLPIFLVASVGFLLARHLHADVRTLSRVTFNALSPCLVFNLLTTSTIRPDEAGRMVLFTVCAVLGVGLIARLVVAPFRLDRSALAAFLVVVMFSNAGNYGLPVSLFAFGKEALARATIYFVTSAALTYTVGVFLASTGQSSFREALAGILKVPVVWSVVAAALLLLTGWRLPNPLQAPIQLLSDGALGAMILVLGMQLERATRPSRPLLVVLAALLSLVVSPLLAIGLAALLGLSGAARQAAVLQASMPAAVVTTILALEYDIEPSFVTSVVFLTTILSPFTVTLLIAFLQR